MSVKEIIEKLENFWAKHGCTILWPYDVEKGAATSNPATFLNVLAPGEYSVAYVDSCKRPQDARYGDNKARLYNHHQFQVLIKPAPSNIEDLYIESLKELGVNVEENSILFLEDNWEQPTIGAWGLGSEIRFNGTEVTQFTYFKQIANIDIDMVPIEIAYGLERLAMSINRVESIFDLMWDENRSYSDMFKRRELENSKYIFEASSKENYFKLFEIYFDEANKALEEKLAIPAYDSLLKASHAFNILDAKRAIIEKDRKRYITKLSKLSKNICLTYYGGSL